VPPPKTLRRYHALEASIRALVIGGAVLIPILISPAGKESFRLPKLALWRAEGLLVGAVLILGIIWGWPGWRTVVRDWRFSLAAFAVIWSVVATLTSSYPLVSAYSLATVIATFFYFVAAWIHGSRFSLPLGAVVIPGIVNVGVYFLQQAGVWNPLVPTPAHRAVLTDEEFRLLSEAALLGNRNDVGAFLVLPTLVAGALAMTSQGSRRLLYALAAVFLTAAVMASRTRTALAALAVSVIVLAATHSLKVLRATLLLIPVGAAAAYLYAPLRAVLQTSWQNLQSGNYDQLLSARVGPFLSAWLIGKEHLLSGVGPGRFPGNYFEYKLKSTESYGSLITPDPYITVSWGEVHNDFLQLFAETGVIGPILFLTFLAILARSSFRSRSVTEPAVRILGLATAVSLALLSLAQFPLQLAATLCSYSYVAAICFTATEAT
jgi:hypothetical protein